MLEALFWGLVSASSLLIGAWLALRFSWSRNAVGLIMAFAAGVLLSAVAYELVLEAVDEHDATGAALGLAAGSVVFSAGDYAITRGQARRRKSTEGREDDGAGLPIVLGTVLDGIPESVVLGLTLISGSISPALLVAVFISNLPEALAASTGLKKSGWSGLALMRLWGSVVVVSGLATTTGYAVFNDAPDRTIAFVMAFAGGAILTMLADSMMPEAYESSGILVGLVTTFGFATAFAVQSLE